MRTLNIVVAVAALAPLAVVTAGCLTAHAVRFDHPAQASHQAAAGCPPSVTDGDGNGYATVLIGQQCWFAENLRVGRYRDGSAIDDDHMAVIDEAKYGRLYRWAALNNGGGLCPAGWHVASDAEYQQLERAVGMSLETTTQTGWRGDGDEARQLKQFDLAREWTAETKAQVNASGFSALPGGGSSGFVTTADGLYGDFWTSTEHSDDRAWYRQMTWWSLHPHRDAIRRVDGDKGMGCSVRCILDAQTAPLR